MRVVNLHDARTSQASFALEDMRWLPDFCCLVRPGLGWKFLYEPLQMETGFLSEDEVHFMALRLGQWEFVDWLRGRVAKECDISPLRVMQIAQVGQ